MIQAGALRPVFFPLSMTQCTSGVARAGLSIGSFALTERFSGSPCVTGRIVESSSMTWEVGENTKKSTEGLKSRYPGCDNHVTLLFQ